VPGLGIRFLYTGAVFLALGALLVVALCRAPEPSRIDPVRLRTLRFAAGALCAALALSLLVLAVQALDVAGKADAQVLSSLLLNSRFGTVWLLRQAALAAALGAVAFMVVRTTRRAATAQFSAASRWRPGPGTRWRSTPGGRHCQPMPCI
jgi:hypothetical protein